MWVIKKTKTVTTTTTTTTENGKTTSTTTTTEGEDVDTTDLDKAVESWQEIADRFMGDAAKATEKIHDEARKVHERARVSENKGDPNG